MSKNFTRRTTLALGGATLGLLAAPSLLRAQSMTKIRLGYPPQVDTVPYWIAQDRGFFAEEGLEVDFIPVGLSAMVPSVASGSVDVVQVNSVQGIQAIDAGLPLTFVTGSYVLPAVGNLSLAKAVGAQLEKPEDLLGKRIATPSFGSILLYMFNYWYDQQGLDYRALDWIEADGPTQRDMFARGELDAGLLYDPFYAMALRDGEVEKFIDFYADTPAGTMVSGQLAMTDWAEGNAETVAAFRRATIKGATLAAAEPEVAKAALKTWAKLSDEIGSLIAIPNYSPEIRPENFEHVLRVMQLQDMLATEITLDQVALPWSV